MKNTKAKTRAKVADCVSNLKPNTQKHSNQVVITGTQGHNTPTAIAHTGKRYTIKPR